MAKDKDKKDKKAKLKIPKQVAGVKVPKKLRKLGDQAVKVAKDPVVSEAVAGALLAAAAALREGKDPRSALGAAVKQGLKGGGTARQETGRLSDGLKLLALDLARRALDGSARKREPEGAAEAPHVQPPAAPAPAAGAAPARPAAQPRQPEPVGAEVRGKGRRGG